MSVPNHVRTAWALRRAGFERVARDVNSWGTVRHFYDRGRVRVITTLLPSGRSWTCVARKGAGRHDPAEWDAICSDHTPSRVVMALVREARRSKP